MHAYVLCSLAKESQNEKPFCSLRLAYRYAEHIERQVRIYSLVDGGNMSNIAEIEKAHRAEWLSYLQQNPDKILDDAIQHSIDRLLPLWPSLAAMAVCPPATEGTTKRREQICENYMRGTCREKKCRRIHPGAGEAQSFVGARCENRENVLSAGDKNREIYLYKESFFSGCRSQGHAESLYAKHGRRRGIRPRRSRATEPPANAGGQARGSASQPHKRKGRKRDGASRNGPIQKKAQNND